MDFAKAQLEKHGWTQGSGLGKEEHGMAEAIKVKLKFDSTGVGHNAADEFTYHWWNHMYNKAAENINVENTKEGVSVSQNEDFTISKKKPLARGLASKDLLYGRFVKAATLDQGEEISEENGSSSSDSDDEDTDKPLNKLTDEELFKICGGRTAHKGARHGLKLNGKLARLQQQEAQSPATSDSEKKKKKKKKKEKKQRDIEKDSDYSSASNNENNDSIKTDVSECASKKSKKKKKKDKKQSDESKSGEFTQCDSLEISEIVCDNNVEADSEKTQKKKKKKSKTKTNEECLNLDEMTEMIEKKVKKKKKRKLDNDETETLTSKKHKKSAK